MTWAVITLGRQLRREQVLNKETACCWGPLICCCPHLSALHTVSQQSKVKAWLPSRSLVLLFQPCLANVLSLSPAGMQKFVTEGQHLELTAITKEQSGSYECIASNDISSPDVRIVQVTVNCKSQNLKTWKHTGRLVWTGWITNFRRKMGKSSRWGLDLDFLSHR